MNLWNDDFAKRRERMEAWWNGAVIDRAVIRITARRKPRPVVPQPADVEQWFTDPGLVLGRLRDEVDCTYYAGEAFPVVYPVSILMVAIMSYYVGCPINFIDTKTVWAAHVLKDWAKRPTYKFDRSNKMWQVTERLLRAAMAESEKNKWYVGIPDLNGPTEILARLRGPEELGFDLIDCPQNIKPAFAELNQTWFDAWKACTDIIKPQGSYFWWMGLWSDKPATDLQADFTCMISTDMFNEYFLPYIEEQTRMVGRTIYHLDGPGAVRHLDALLELPKLTGIQWVPGAGAPPAVEWMPLLKKVQAAGKLLYTSCEPEHVGPIMQQLKPEGLVLSTSCDTVAEADELLKNVYKWTATRK